MAFKGFRKILPRETLLFHARVESCLPVAWKIYDALCDKNLALQHGRKEVAPFPMPVIFSVCSRPASEHEQRDEPYCESHPVTSRAPDERCTGIAAR